MTLRKYIKQPVAGSIAQYTDSELRKVESSFNSLIMEFDNMAAANFESGNFVLTLTGCTTSPQVTASYARAGNLVIIFIPLLQATSNTTACTITGLPAALKPVANSGLQTLWVRNPGNELGGAVIQADGVIKLYRGFSDTGFIASGNKGINDATLVYNLN